MKTKLPSNGFVVHIPYLDCSLWFIYLILIEIGYDIWPSNFAVHLVLEDPPNPICCGHSEAKLQRDARRKEDQAWVGSGLYSAEAAGSDLPRIEIHVRDPNSTQLPCYVALSNLQQ